MRLATVARKPCLAFLAVVYVAVFAFFALYPSFSGAAILSNAPITNAVLASMLGDAAAPQIESPFYFAFPGALAGQPSSRQDGFVRSQVHYGAGAAVGEYVYLYQIIHARDSSENSIGGFVIPWQGLAPDDLGPGIGTSFYRPNLALVPADYVRYVNSGDNSSVAFLFSDPANPLLPGKDSVLLGMVSPLAPGLFPVNVLATDRQLPLPSAYAPVPVPAALPLFLTGLAGAALLRRRRS